MLLVHANRLMLAVQCFLMEMWDLENTYKVTKDTEVRASASHLLRFIIN